METIKLGAVHIARAKKEYDETCAKIARAAVKYLGTLECLDMNPQDTAWQEFAEKDKKVLNNHLRHLKKLENMLAKSNLN